MLGNTITNELENKIQTYREQKFTGFVKVSGQSEYQWYIYYLLGRIVWVRSRMHTLRQWQRYLSFHSPVFFEQLTQPVAPPHNTWNYATLARLVKLKKFRRDQFYRIAEGCIIENLFDVLQNGALQHSTGYSLTCHAYAKEAASMPFIMLEKDTVWSEAKDNWQTWQHAELAEISPDYAPKIIQLELLRQQAPPQSFQVLESFVDGETTLRELAFKFKQPVLALTKSISPYVSRGMLSLVELPDIVENADEGFHPELVEIDTPKAEQTTPDKTPQSQSPNASAAAVLPPLPPIGSRNVAKLAADISSGRTQKAQPNKGIKNSGPRIIYIDDSPADSRAMSNVVTALGYQYTNIPDPLQALPMLLELKPKLIFLDLVMPIANGYEVCSQIRRISAFKDIPVVIVTSNDGIADRVRARIVGASGFLGKPIQQKKVEKVLNKHLSRLSRPRPQARRGTAELSPS